jgi:hypothetical protein
MQVAGWLQPPKSGRAANPGATTPASAQFAAASLLPFTSAPTIRRAPLAVQGGSVVAGGGGAFVYFGKRRGGMLLDFQGQDITGVVGSDTEAWLLAAMTTAHIALVPSGRIWVRCGIGQGWTTGGASEEQGVSVGWTGKNGLALTTGAGVSV